MEEVNQTQEVESTQSEETTSSDALMKRLEQLESSNKRLLDESKGWATKYKGLKGEVESKTEESLKEQGKWKEIVEQKEMKLKEVEQLYNQEKQAAARLNLNLEVARYASDAYDISDVIPHLPSDLIQRTDNGFQGIDKAVDYVRAHKAYLFKKDNPGFTGKRPTAQPTSKDMNSLTSAEKMEALKVLLAKK